MDVLVSDEARGFIAERGGTVFVRAGVSRCCHGSISLLRVGTDAPADAARFDAVDGGGLDVRYLGTARGRPDALTIELRGRLRPHLVAYKDGCALEP